MTLDPSAPLTAAPARTGRTPLPCFLFLLSISVLINYVDRGNLSVAAPLIKGELHISAAQLGVLLSAFFWTYTGLMYPSGWLADRFNVNWVLAGGFVIWSLATSATALAHSFFTLIVVRMLLGAAESVAFPSYGRILARHVGQEYRGVANAMIMSAMSLGPAVGAYGCGVLMASYGWRPVFFAIGLVSLLWVLPWLRWMPDAGDAEDRATLRVPAFEILRRRPFWGAAVGHFCGTYAFYFVLLWLPFYLVGERHLSIGAMAFEVAWFYVAYASAAPVGGYFGDWLIRSGAAPGRVRKSCMALGHGLVAVGVLGCAAANPRVSFACLVMMGIGCGIVGPNIFVFAQTLAGPSVAGKFTGLQNMVGNLCGVVVGPLSGLIVDDTGHFWWAFVIASVLPVLGGLSWVFLVGPVEQIAWRQTNAPRLRAKVMALPLAQPRRRISTLPE